MPDATAPEAPSAPLPPPPSPLRRFVQSSLVYGAVAMPAMWLLGGSRGVRLVGASAAVGAAVTAAHTVLRVDPLAHARLGAQARAGVRELAARGDNTLLGSTGQSVIDIMGSDG